MVSMTVELRNVEGTEAAMGWAGGHTIVVDRPPGKAGGRGLGFNGAELLALAIGGCFCNDLRYVANDMGVGLGKIAVSVTVEMAGNPLLTTGARMAVSCRESRPAKCVLCDREMFAWEGDNVGQLHLIGRPDEDRE
jgi:organic hydroperoxide reductase OsmC/OhrA